MNIIKYLVNDTVRILFKYIPWLIIGFLIGCINVSAETISAQPDQVNFYKGYTNTLIFSDTTANNYTIAGNNFYGYSTGTSVSDSPLSARIFYKNSQFSSVPKNKTNTLMFTLFSTAKISSVMIDTGSNYFTCNILNTTFVDSDTTNTQAIVYSIYCPKFQFISSNLYINLNYAIDNGINQPLGVLKTFTYIIDENTNINNSIQQGNEKLDDINNSITSSDTDSSNVSNTLNNVSVGNEGVITQLITFPINLFTNVLNSINGQCTSFNLGNLFGTNLILPCINIENIVGSNLWSIIDILFSGFSIYYISNKIKKIFEQLTNLREGDVIND